MAASVILAFAMNGAGATRIPMLATFLALVMVQIPLALWLPGWTGAGLSGVWYAIAIAILVQCAALNSVLPPRRVEIRPPLIPKKRLFLISLGSVCGT